MVKAGADAHITATFRWIEHNLAEYDVCENSLDSTGVIADKIK